MWQAVRSNESSTRIARSTGPDGCVVEFEKDGTERFVADFTVTRSSCTARVLRSRSSW